MLMRFDPYRDIDRLSEQLGAGGQAPRSFPMDATRRGDEFIVEFDLPGFAAESVELTVERNVLTVKAERRFERRQGDEVIVAERPEGVYTRQLFLGDTLDADRIEADYDAGVLRLRIPVAEAAKPRRVEISGGRGSQPIEARGSGAQSG